MNIKSLLAYTIPPLIGCAIIFVLNQVVLLRFEGVVSDLRNHAFVSDAIASFVHPEDNNQSVSIRRFLGLGIIGSVCLASVVVCLISSIITGVLTSSAARYELSPSTRSTTNHEPRPD